jgi:hypothetical protein
VEYGDGELRYVRLGEREVVRRLYVAVRDANWGTVPGRMANEQVESDTDTFRIRFAMIHREGEIDFAWRGSIDGAADGTIRFAMDGEARSSFRRNRIGFCVLHPIRECAGAQLRCRQADGTERGSTFPDLIAPHSPFHELQWLSHEVEPGVWAELEFKGELFEMEDQRNWIDASFKTFCTPLRIPFPVTVAAGEEVRQSVTLRLSGASRAPRADRASAGAEVNIQETSIGPLPAIGLGLAAEASPPTPREAERLRALQTAHLRVELRLSDPTYPEELRRSVEQATAIGSGLEVALTLSDRGDEELAGFVDRLRALRPPVRRWLVFHENDWATSEPWIRLALRHLAAFDATIPLVSGTTANFAELNRHRPPVELLGGICYSAQPQEHASDNASLVETCAALGDTLRTARSFAGGRPVLVTPITLRRRVNPYATGPAPPGGLPARVDPRQMALLGAAWTLGSLKALAEGGASSTTWYETVGWLGVMEAADDCPKPGLFPSRPGMVFPLYHVLADANEWSDATVVASSSNRPLQAEVLAFRSGQGLRVLLANLQDESVAVAVSGLGEVARVRTLDETSFERATMAPEQFRAEAGTQHETAGGRLMLDLKPYAYVRMDVA